MLSVVVAITGCGRCWYAGGGTSVECCCIQVVVDVGMLEEGPVLNAVVYRLW